MASTGRLTLRVGDGDTLPPLPLTEQRRVVEQFRDHVTALALANADNRAWWFSWLSSRDRNHCPLAADLLWLEQAQVWLEGQSGAVTLTCPDADLAHALAARAKALGWLVKAPLRWPTLAPLADAAKALAVGLLTWRAARRHPYPGLGGHDTVLLSWADKRVLGARQPRDDVYFGPLRRLLEQAGEKVLPVSPLMGEPGQLAVITAAATHLGHASIGHGLTLADVVLSVAQAMVERIRWTVPDPALKRRALFRRVIYSAQARMIERAVGRILAANSAARLIRIYENLPWERAADLAAHRLDRHVTGYLHCAVLPSHLNFYLDAAEATVRPRPDRIVCTGPTARDVLLSLGQHDPDHVLPGMALRGPDPARLPLVQGQQPIRTVLVLLEGLPRMVSLLRVLDQAARHLPDVRLLVRAHPMLPLERLAALAGITTGPGQPLQPSLTSGLETAIAEADAVIYQGTTAALTAALMGVPLLWFDAGLAITDDPLFRCPHFKRGFATPDELGDAIAELDLLDETVRQQQRHALRAYVLDYLRPPSTAALADFRVAPTPAVGAH